MRNTKIRDDILTTQSDPVSIPGFDCPTTRKPPPHDKEENQSREERFIAADCDIIFYAAAARNVFRLIISGTPDA
jgi:hypothetical protein